MNNYNIYQVNYLALSKNYLAIKQAIGNKKICAMLKANGYGVGVKYLIPFLKGKVDFYGVSCVGEAKEIKRYDKKTPILIVGKTPKKDLAWCSKNHVRVSISNIEEYKECVKEKQPLLLHIKINTGMNRYGMSKVHELKHIVDTLPPYLVLEGIMTHFATKASDEEFIDEQYKTFQCFVALVPKNCIVHCANSYTTLHKRAYQMDMVRIGYALYNGVEPVVNIFSHIIEIQTLQKGDTLGYDRTYKAKKTTRIGVVPIGYADGLDRRLSNHFSVWCNGHRANIVGNICMDVFFIELDDHDQIADRVELLGNHIRYDEYAKALTTSNYDVMLKWKDRRMKHEIIGKKQ